MGYSDLNISYWLVSSRPALRKFGFGLLIAIDVGILVTIALTAMRYIASNNAFQHSISAVAQNTIRYADITARREQPQLSTTSVTVLGDAKNGYTFVAVVQNPSQQWLLETATYSFVLDGNVIASGTTSFFAGEERYLVQPNVHIEGVPASSMVRCVFSDERWHNVLGSVNTPKNDLLVVQPVYRILSPAPTNPLSQVLATVKNPTVYTFTNVEVGVLLTNGGTIIGASTLVLDRVEPLSEREIDIRFVQAIAVATVRARISISVKDTLSDRQIRVLDSE